MSRIDFFRKVIRYIFLLLMTIIVLALGNRIVTGRNCSHVRVMEFVMEKQTVINIEQY